MMALDEKLKYYQSYYKLSSGDLWLASQKNLSNSREDISLKTTNVNLMVVLEQGSTT